MKLEGKVVVKAPIQKLWNMVLEPETLQACLPGAEKIERLDEMTYTGWLQQKVGPIKVRFKGKVILTKLEPPTHLEMEGEGDDIGKAGRVVQKTSIDLKEIPGGGGRRVE